MSSAGSNRSNPATRVWTNARCRPLLSLLVIFLLCGLAAAQTDVYHIRGNATATSDNIWIVDTTSAAEVVVFTNYTGGNAATLGQRASDGMLFYAINSGSNGAVYRFNPATPSIAPVLLGNIGPSTSGGTVGDGFRMAFLGNTLYYMPGGGGADNNTLYTVNQTTGRATSVATITGTGNGGDMAFNAGGTLYIINQNRQLYTASVAGGAATLVGTVTFPGGATPGTLGLAFDSAGRLLIQTQSPSNLYRITLPSLAASLFAGLSGGTTATGDLASANVPAPNLSITKTDGVTTVYRGGPVSYTVVVTNNSTYPITGTVTDTVPATVTGVTWNCVASAGTICTTASGSGNSLNTSAILQPAGTATYTISGTLSASASGTLTNTATVAVPTWLTDSTPANNTATDVDTITLNANLGVTKTDGLANVNPGSPITYTIVVSNASPDTSSGSIITDTVPATITGVNWTCGSPTGGATCGAPSGSGNSINTTANLPSGSTLTYTVTGTLSLTATGTLTNTARIVTPASGVTDPNDPGRTGAANNSATDNTTINPVPDLTIAKSHSGNFTQGQVGATYSITVTNSGAAATSGTVTVTDTLPASLTATNISGAGWACVLATRTCTRSNALAVAASYPVITLTVTVSPTAPASVTNTAVVSGGGEVIVSNNTANDPTTINPAAPPNVGLVKSVSPSGAQVPGTDLTYTIVYTNTGGQPATTFVIVDPNPLNVDPLERVLRNVDFKLGTMTSTPGTTGLVATFAYSNDGGLTWTYTPVSGGGGAPAGYDRAVTNVRWSFAGNLSQLAPNNSASVSFTVRIR